MKFKNLLFFLFFAFLLSPKAQAQLPTETQPTIAPPIPDSVFFAGERLPLEDPDVRERLDRELMSNMYKHARLLLIIKRAGRWKEPIEKILCQYGIPKDFFYLAVAESNLDNYALSSSRALGMWQFLEETGKEFGLEVSDHVDERKDALIATEAACKYLSMAYEKFGTWSAVAASYNRGMGGLQRAMKAQKVNSYYDLYLNRETYRYVFRIAALKLILENPEAYGFCLKPEDYYPTFTFKEIKVTEDIPDLPSFALRYGITYKTLKVYNPWLDSAKYALDASPNKPRTLRLPVDAPDEPLPEKDKNTP